MARGRRGRTVWRRGQQLTVSGMYIREIRAILATRVEENGTTLNEEMLRVLVPAVLGEERELQRRLQAVRGED